MILGVKEGKNIGIDNLLQHIEVDKANVIAEAQAKADKMTLSEIASLVSSDNPNDYSKVRHYIDSMFVKVKSMPMENSHTWPDVFKERLRLMNPEWIKLAYPERINPTLESLSTTFHETSKVIVNPDISYVKNVKDYCENIIISCLSDDDSLSTRIHLIKSLDIKILKSALPNFPDITAEKLLADPVKYLGDNYGKYLLEPIIPSNNKYDTLILGEEVHI